MAIIALEIIKKQLNSTEKFTLHNSISCSNNSIYHNAILLSNYFPTFHILQLFNLAIITNASINYFYIYTITHTFKSIISYNIM